MASNDQKLNESKCHICGKKGHFVANYRVKLGNCTELTEEGSVGKESTEKNMRRIYSQNLVDLVKKKKTL